jgi:hypothetical protein
LRVVVGADRERGAVGRRDALDLAQNPLAACGNRPLDQLLLAVERDFVRPVGGDILARRKLNARMVAKRLCSPWHPPAAARRGESGGEVNVA